MASRFEQREVVIQTLFECDFNNNLDLNTIKVVLERNAKNFLLLDSVPEFAGNIAIGIILKKDILDEIISKAAPDWPLKKISIIDRSLLRLGIFELIYGQDFNIPPKVAINEAIELAKEFGGDNSRKFINGVLGGIFKEMNSSLQSANQHETSSENLKIHKNKLTTDILVGAAVLKDFSGVWKIGFVEDIFKHFTLPKGHLKTNKDELASLIEIVKEETNLTALPLDVIGDNSYIANIDGKNFKKQVKYFLCKLQEEDVFVPSEGKISFAWFSKEEIANKKTYKDMQSVISKAFALASQQVK